MPKQIDYPRATLKNSLELARAVDGLGGKSSVEMVADALNKKVSGAFQALVGSTIKYGLIVSKQGQLETTQLYRNYKLAYSEEESASKLSEAFLGVPLFRDIYARFEGKPFPINHFEKLLVREFEVPDQMGSRVAKYFLDGAKQCNLIGPEHVLRVAGAAESGSEEGNGSEGGEDESTGYNALPAETSTRTAATAQMAVTNQNLAQFGDYSVRITGPGMDSMIAVNDEEDLLIVRAMLKKVEKKLQERSVDGE